MSAAMELGLELLGYAVAMLLSVREIGSKMLMQYVNMNSSCTKRYRALFIRHLPSILAGNKGIIDLHCWFMDPHHNFEAANIGQILTGS